MTKLLLGTITLIAWVGVYPASAADLPIKAPIYTPAAAPTWSWTGFYFGANAGYGIGRDPGGFDIVIPGTVFAPTPERFTYSPAGAIGGVQAGYNWQFDPHWVAGIEADLQASSQGDSFTCVQQCLNVPAIAVLNGTPVSQRLKWFDTARGRLGWTDGPALWYATGGLAVGDLRTSITTIQQGGTPLSLDFNDTEVGWAAGGGLEYRLLGNWTAKAEYLYMSLGSVSHAFAYNNNGVAGFPTQNFYYSHVHDSIVRLGVNYKFSWGDPGTASAAASASSILAYKAPVKRPPIAPAAWNWSGIYGGANLGVGLARDPFIKIGTFNTTGNTILDESFYLMPVGVIGGGQLGLNWQVSSLVLGAEADYQLSDQHSNTTCATFCDPTAGSSIALIKQREPWFATVRGRVGWTNGPGLIYVTGGAAFTEVKTSISQSDFNGIPLVLNAFDFNRRQTGAAAGGGIEHQIIGNWTGKVEYLYMNFGSVADIYANPPPPSPFATTHSITSSTRDNVVRFGLNYKFGGPFIFGN